MAFNPDAYLKSIEQAPVDTFDPDAYLKSLTPQLPTVQEEKGFLSNVGSLIGRGSESALASAEVSPAILAGTAPEKKAGIIAKELSTPQAVAPKELKEVQTAFLDEAAAMDKAKHWYSKEGLIAGADFLGELGTQMITNPKGMAYLTSQSAANMAPSIVGMLIGGKTGAAVGTAIVPGVGTAVGGISGSLIGGFAGQVPMETGSEFIGLVGQELSARGLEPTEANVTALLKDKKFVNKAISDARTKGVTTAAVDSAMTLLGGRIASGPRRAAVEAARRELGAGADAARLAERAAQIIKETPRLQKISAGAKGVGLDVVGGGASEAAGQELAYGKVNLSDVGQEMLGELGGAAIEVPAAAYSATRDLASKQGAVPADGTVPPAAGIPPVTPGTPAPPPVATGPAVLSDEDIETLDEEAPTPVATKPAAPKVAFDAARAQELKNSIAEGEMIAKSGKKTDGTKMSKDELDAVKRSIDNSKIKLNEVMQPETSVTGVTDVAPPVVKMPTTTNPEEQKAAMDKLAALPIGGIMEVSGGKYRKTEKGWDIVKDEAAPAAAPVETAPLEAAPATAPTVAPVEPLHTVVNNETKMEASVYPRDDGTFNVAQKDLESGETLPTFKNFKSQEEAVSYANTVNLPKAPVEKPKTKAQINQERQQAKRINAINAADVPLDAYASVINSAMMNDDSSNLIKMYGDNATKAVELLKNNNLITENESGKLSLLPAGQGFLTDIRNYKSGQPQQPLFAKYIKQLQEPVETTEAEPEVKQTPAEEWNSTVKSLQGVSNFPNVPFEELTPALQKKIAATQDKDGKLGGKNIMQFGDEIEKQLKIKENQTRQAEQKTKQKAKSGTLLTKLINLGGVSIKDKRDVTGEKQSFPPGYARAFRANAPTSLRGHIERGDLDEFLPNNMRLSANTMEQGPFDSEPAYDYLSGLIKNGQSVTPYVEAEKEASEFDRYTGTETMLSDSEGDALDDLVKWAEDNGLDIEAIKESLVGDTQANKERNLIRMLQEARDEEQSATEPVEVSKGQARADNKVSGQEAAGELELTGQTEAEIKSDEAKAKAAAEAKAKEEAQAEQKRKAEKETFALTGSDREADNAAAAGVQGLFDKTELEVDFERIKNNTVKFSSGLTSISDLESGAKAKRGNELSGIGIDIGELSTNGLNKLAEAILGGTRVFVDSGAFSTFRSNVKNDEDKSLNFDSILEKYNAITQAVEDLNDVQDYSYPRPMFVMPDIVGNQDASLRLAEKYADFIKADADFDVSIPIVPIQKGELTLAEAYNKIVSIIGTNKFVVGLPSNAEAISQNELREFFKEVKPANVHFLGAAADKTLTPLLQIVAKESPKTKVTADASQIRSKILSNVSKGMNRKQAINAALNDFTDPQWNEEFKNYGIKESDFNKVRERIASNLKKMDKFQAFNSAINEFAPKKEEAPEAKTEKPEYYKYTTREQLHKDAEAIENMDADVRENTEVGDFPGVSFGYDLYEAKKMLPKPSDKLKKITDDNSFHLYQGYDYIANVDGEYYGITKQEDPDDPDNEKAFVFHYNRMDEPVGKDYESWTSDPKELIDIIRNQAAKEKLAAEPNKKPTKIEDFGEKIFVKKDAWINFKKKVDESKDVDIEEAPLSKSWVEPDYQKLLDDGMSPFSVAFLRSARDAVPTKPKVYWRLRSWVNRVEKLRDLSYALIDGTITEEQIKNALNKDDDDKSSINYYRLKSHIDLYLAAGHEKSLKGYTLEKHSWTLYNGIKYDPPGVVLWEVRSANGTQISESENKEEAIAKFVNEINKPKGEIERKEIKFGVYSQKNKDGFFIGKKIGKNVVDLKWFTTVKEAREFLQNNHDELVDLLEKYKDIPSERGEINEARVGADYRMGADVSQEQFFDTFGFRSTIFGNTVNNARRQQDLNNAYDALMDLAGILEIPPKALSMNGEIGLLFGADGRGGKNPASAHYSNSKLAINLTKTNGAGSLAHELFHALDNYFSRMGGDKYGMLTEKQKASANVRPEVVAAFKELMTAINATSIKQRSQNLDKRRTQAYWSTGLEMAARSFESYVINKLKDQNASNDYLANIVSEKEFNIEDGYPYPTAAETPAIRAAFDNFFKVLQTKETDKGIMLYNVESKSQVETPAFKKWFGNSKIVNKDGSPKVLYHGTQKEFSAFKVGDGAFGRGVYLTGIPDRTTQYWGGYKKFGGHPDLSPAGGNIVPVYVRMENPKQIDTDIFKVKLPEGVKREDAAKYITEQAIKEGHDGLITMSGDNIWEVVVFEPSQIKSAIGNKGTFDETGDILQNQQQFVKDGIAYESEEDYRDRQIQELRVASMQIGKLENKVADYGSDIPLQRKLNKLRERKAALKAYIDSTKPDNNSAVNFMATATRELNKENISSEVEAVIRQVYEKYPGVLEGVKLSVKKDKSNYGNVLGRFNPYEQMVNLYKGTSGVYNAETVRHELMHSLEQMMTPQAKMAVVDEWAKALEKAMKKHRDPASKAYFDAVLKFLESPSKENFDAATKKMPPRDTSPVDFYQYINPSEYWAVNAEQLFASKLGTPWNRFVIAVKRLIEGLKNVLGFDNNYQVHKVFNNLLKTTPERMSKQMLIDYVTKGKVKLDFLQNVEEDRNLVDEIGVPSVPSHTTRTAKEFLFGGWKKTQETAIDIANEPKANVTTALSKAGDLVTLGRIRNVWYGAGLDAADFAKYGGQIRDAMGRLLPSIALKNAIKAAYISTRVILDGGLEMNERHGIFMAVKKAHSMANVFKLQAKLRKEMGVELADRVINGYFIAKRSRSIQNNYFDISGQVRILEEELLTETDPELVDELSSELASLQTELKNIKIAYEKIPAFLCKIDENEPTITTEDGKEVPNVLYDDDGLPLLNDEAMDNLINQDVKHPELKEMMVNWTAVNHNMLDMMAFSGRISQKEADKLKSIKDYSPWARLVDERQGLYDARAISANTSGIKHFKSGRTELDVDNVIESMTHNIQSMVKSSVRTYAYNRIAIEYGTRKPSTIDRTTGLEKPGKLKVYPDDGRFAEGIRIPIFANGRRIIIQIEDSNIAEAMLGLAMGPIDFPMQNVLSAAANLTRRTITFSLYFQAKQVFYDAPTAAWVSGVRNPFKLWAGCFSAFARSVVNPDNVTAEVLKSAGFGGFQSHHRSAKGELELELGIMNRSLLSRFLKGIDHFGDASDLSQRIPIYEQTIAETGDPMLAILKASDVMDFQKSGNGRPAQWLKVTVPFMQAYATQLDALGQAAIGGNLKGMSRKQAKAQFIKTGSLLAGTCLLYAFIAGGDDDYWELDDNTRLRNFYIPGSKKLFGHHVLIPMHSTASYFFKAIPEMLYSTVTSQGTKNEIDMKRLRTVLADSAYDSLLGPTPIPSGVKPFIEIAFNHDFFTGGNVTPRSLEKLDAVRQYNASTSEMGKMISSLTGTDKHRLLNPIEADKLMRGILGSVGALSMYYSNVIFGEDRVAPQLKDNPLTGGIIGADVQRKNEDLLYSLAEITGKADATFNDLHKKGFHEEAREYFKENKDLIKANGYVKASMQSLDDLNAEIKRIGGSPNDKTYNTPEKRLARINELKEIKNKALKDVIRFRLKAGL